MIFFNEIKGNVVFLVISETKLQDKFPKIHLRILSLAPILRKDQNQIGGDIMVFKKEDIPEKFLFTERTPVEAIG